MRKGNKTTRIQRVNELMERQLATIIHREIVNPELKMITVTGVDVARDLSYAKIYFTVLVSKEAKEPKECEKIMNTYAAFLRGRLSSAVDLRVTPELRFVYDRSIAYGENIAQLLEKTKDPEH
jgi:ribosome-binding factor A